MYIIRTFSYKSWCACLKQIHHIWLHEKKIHHAIVLIFYSIVHIPQHSLNPKLGITITQRYIFHLPSSYGWSQLACLCTHGKETLFTSLQNPFRCTHSCCLITPGITLTPVIAQMWQPSLGNSHQAMQSRCMNENTSFPKSRRKSWA